MPRLDCDGCKGTGKVWARIQPTDRSKPCVEDWRPCPLCSWDEPRPRYSCFVAGCPGEHESKWQVCSGQTVSENPK